MTHPRQWRNNASVFWVVNHFHTSNTGTSEKEEFSSHEAGQGFAIVRVHRSKVNIMERGSCGERRESFESSRMLGRSTSAVQALVLGTGCPHRRLTLVCVTRAVWGALPGSNFLHHHSAWQGVYEQSLPPSGYPTYSAKMTILPSRVMSTERTRGPGQEWMLLPNRNLPFL